ncbi:unnamed protein product [Brassica rapa subsp. narinosa]
MEGTMCLFHNLIWVMLLMGHLHGYESCIEKERNALLEFKKYLISQSIEEESNSVLPTWTNDTKSDCCLWEGLKCSRISGRVTEIAFGGLNLKENTPLNLSLLHPFEDVRSFNLSGGALNKFNGLFDDVEGYNSLRRLTNLKILDLSSNKFNNSVFSFLNAATTLTTLFLRSNNMGGSLPAKDFRDLTNLELLDLSRNRFNGSIPLQELSEMRKLKALDLSRNEFSDSTELKGKFPQMNIQELDLSHNKLVGQFPLCLTHLSGLRVLDLSSNQLTGKLPPSLGSLKSLEYLSLFDNDFEGVFSLGSLTNLSNLRVLKLCSKSNSLQVVSDSSWKPKFQLDVIALRSCNLDKVPQFLLHQKELRHVDLSDNNISGNFPSWLLENNTKLKVLLLQNNSFTSFQVPKSPHHLLFMDVSVNKFNHLLPENIGWILPHLRYMNISNNSFQGTLPSSLGNMKNTEYMDLSRNSFRGELPKSFLNGCDSMAILKLSHNKLTGEIFQEPPKFTNILGLFMDNNLFTGKLGEGLKRLRNLSLLDISNNNLTGVVPSWIGELPSLTALLIANNLLEGNIPTSLFNNSNLQLLDLSTNNLSGGIPPQHNSKNGVVLLLQDNHLSGEMSDTQLANVEILDLRNNKLSGSIPEFIKTQNISVLLLRGNDLTGRIPHQLCGLINIQLLDLSRNRLNGSIPSCLSNTSFVTGKKCTSYDYDFGISFPSDVFDGFSLQQDISSTNDSSRYFKSLLMLDPFSMDYKASTQTKIEFATKYRYDSYMGKNLKLLYGLDLSENELSGEIPAEFGELMELRAFNLSHNNLSGAIPESFSGLKNVESLDISFNRLQGRIPQELTQLSTLSVFKVSYNNLSGAIPQGRQFNTFDTQSFVGNNLLCGQPTSRSCNSGTFQEPDSGEDDDDESAIDMESFYWSFGAVYVTILVGLFASLSFNSPWSRFWFHMIDAFINKLQRYKSCVENERKALFELKKYIFSITEEDEFELKTDYLPSWTDDTTSDCCQWAGVMCNKTSKRVTEISFGELKLKQSSLLNLSLLHPFEEVRTLNLSKSRFSFLYPIEERGWHEETNNQFAGFFDDVEGYKSLGRLRNLELLDLSSNKFNNSIFPFLNAATSLRTLFLRDNYMGGPRRLKELQELINLELLDLSINSFNGTIPIKELSTLRKLKALDLSDNEFSGSIELQGKFKFLHLTYVGICKLKNMQELDLSRNKLVSQFPICLTGLTGLRVLDLSSNQMTGKLPSALSNLVSLEYLSLFDNNFEGLFSLGSLSNLSKLRVIKLGSKSKSLQVVESEGSWKPKFQLNAIVLGSSNLDKFPHFLRQQKGLREVDLSNNKISGNFPTWLIENNKELQVLRLQNNYLTSFQLPKSTHGLGFLDVSVNKFNHLFPENIGWILPRLTILNISSNGFQGKLPSSLSNMTEISYLDLSHNSFQGKIPQGLLKECYSIKLSHNKLSGEVFPEEVPLFSSISELFMDNNQFTGKIGQGLRDLQYLSVLDISNNSLSGVIPNWIGQLPQLTALLLSNNSLEGNIPTTLFNMSNLYLLDLSANRLSGDIPPHIISAMPSIVFLQDNNLSGIIPDTLLMNVTVLDLRNNRLSGNIPEFTNIQSIGILLLRGNNLTGRIPRQLCGLRTIHLLDLANNRLNGPIPSCLGNASFGLGKEDALYLFELRSGEMSTSFELGYALEQDSTPSKGVGGFFNSLLVLDPFIGGFMEKSTRTKIEFATKHRYDSYMGGNLELLIGMDLSENELSGEIPFGLGDLHKLHALNLSHNILSGVIPKSFSGLRNVESLDLSFNRLQGRIPSQLAELSSLAVFNVSFNNLSGSIPQGRQFNTFDSQSFIDNPFLCGLPTNIICNFFQEPGNEVEDDEGLIDMISFYWSFTAAYVTILLGILSSLTFDSPWSRFWFYTVDVSIHKVRNLLFCN